MNVHTIPKTTINLFNFEYLYAAFEKHETNVFRCTIGGTRGFGVSSSTNPLGISPSTRTGTKNEYTLVCVCVWYFQNSVTPEKYLRRVVRVRLGRPIRKFRASTTETLFFFSARRIARSKELSRYGNRTNDPVIRYVRAGKSQTYLQ